METQKLSFRKLKKSEYEVFYNSLKCAREHNEHGLYVILRDKKLYKDTKNFLLGDGIAGFAIDGNEFISVHKNPDKAHQHNIGKVFPEMVSLAFKNGAEAGDCYDEFLAEYHMSCGFIAVASVPFNDIYDNPDNWDSNRFGKPNVYILARAIKNDQELNKLKKENKLLHFADIKPYIKTIEDYDEALAYRDKLLEKFRNMNYEQIANFVLNNNS